MKIRGAVLETMEASAPYAESQPLRVEELELGEPGPTELRVRITAAGVCHSDLSVVNGNRPRPLPMLLGHEAAGVVEAVGAEVTDLAEGQHVVMAFLPRCGECAACRTEGLLPCTVGTKANTAGTLMEGSMHLSDERGQVYHHLGVSGFATHAVVDRRSVVPVGEDVPAAVAAVMGCAVLTGGGAVINAAKATPDDAVAVVGLGGVGLAALLVAKAVGCRRVIAVDALAEKLELAKEFGADEALTPDELVALEEKPRVVIEAAGHPRAFETAVNATAAGGVTVTVGLPAPGAMSSIEPLKITAEARQIIGSYLGSAVPAVDIPKYERMWRDGVLPLEKLITSHVQLEQINEAMDELDAGRAVRQIIEFPED
ncbi:zinc-binding dehydrogenase [Kocuria rosea]|uniref:zinc-binding dehydrogenase n=1 Tax=Kocuria rosea TaxID=1275 RepID=UPI00203B9535|nr:zinc-binding dehydrogenase [Kocuria rosea]MCM3688525.1 alcohol dehydrogenase catalytic domain-containing protein [Kocuria rosea]